MENKTYYCEKCDKTFQKRHAYIGHCSVHTRAKKEKVIVEKVIVENDKEHFCKFCNRKFDKGVQLGGHTTYCHLNPKRLETIEKVRKTSIGRTLTENSKKKISVARISYLLANPDKAPYIINHSSKKSYPEIIFENALNESNIKGWLYNYQQGLYSYDFAWPEYKIDVEIDGGTHTSAKVILIDERRDLYSKSNGWKVIRFTAKEIKSNVLKCIKKLLMMCPEIENNL